MSGKKRSNRVSLINAMAQLVSWKILAAVVVVTLLIVLLITVICKWWE